MSDPHDCWDGCYRDGWNGLICPDAYAHPAKFARGLIQRIYQHAKAQGWLRPGDWVLDPFSGVSLGAHDALLQGYHVVHCELEPKFHALAQQNVALWQQRYGHVPGYGQAVLLQGDSRRLREVLSAADLCVSSPPYSGNAKHDYRITDADGNDRDVQRGYRQGLGCFRGSETYGQTPGNLGHLPPGDVTLACASPPYAEVLHDQRASRGPGQTSRHDPRKQGLRYTADGASSAAGYGTTAGNLGSLSAGRLAEMAVSSPPYGDQQVGTGAEGRTGWRGYTDHGGGLTAHGAQLAAMPTHDDPSTFWSAARQILEQVYAVLTPGGHAIWVVKSYVRDSTIIDFPCDWRRLCEAVGFVTLHEHHALLVEEHGTQGGLFGEDTTHRTERKSFFRRLHEKKRPDLAIDYEVVYCMEKPA